MKATRSECFLGQNLWSQKYALKHNLDWSEVTFDTENTSHVLYDANKTGESLVPARIVQKNSEGNGKTPITYDIEVQNEGNKIIKAVSGEQLKLREDSALEKAEVFYKANCLAKLICDKSQNDRVVGLHFIGPNAGEVVQGFALAISMGATKQQFDELVGIHPTAAEEFTVLTVTKESNETLLKPAGCGGGSCG